MNWYKKAKNEIPIYRGEYAGNKGGNYFSTSKEFARQFTQKGLESEVIQKRIDLSLIYDARTEGKPLPDANNEKEFDDAMARTKELHLYGFRLSEGTNEPNSIYMLDTSSLVLKNTNPRPKKR